MIRNKFHFTVLACVILSIAICFSSCGRGSDIETSSIYDTTTTTAPTPIPDTTTKGTTATLNNTSETASSSTTAKPTTQATTQATTTQTTSAVKPTTEATTAKPTTQATTTQSPTTEATTAPTTQATTQATTEAPTETTLQLHYNKLDTALFVQQSFAEVNKMRAEVGAEPVVMAPQIVQDYAMLRAKEEGENWSWVNNIDHVRPNGEWAMEELDRLYFSGVIKYPLSENVTYSDIDYYTGDSMTRSFEWSTGHYNNIVSSRAGSVAIGYYYNEKLWMSFQIIIFLEK